MFLPYVSVPYKLVLIVKQTFARTLFNVNINCGYVHDAFVPTFMLGILIRLKGEVLMYLYGQSARKLCTTFDSFAKFY